jgi:DNA-binding Lrp family transcriptional regulator
VADFTARLLEIAQGGLPLESRPFLVIAEQLGVTEDEVIARLAELEREGVIREMSVFLNPPGLGYRSTLACMKVPPDCLDEVTNLLAGLPEVTHNYLRAHDYNVWFTVIAPSEGRLQQILDNIAAQSGCGPIHNLPAETIYKIRVAFKADEMSP